MANLFVSYSRADKAFARRLRDSLVAAGHEVWVDWEDIPPTAEWLTDIKSAVDKADAVMFILSTTSAASTTCGIELSHAAERHKRLIPIVIDGVRADVVPPVIAKLQWIFCRPEDDIEAGIAAALKAIDLDLDWLRAHTRLLTRALEWQARNRDASPLLRGSDLRAAEEALVHAAGKEPSPLPVQQEYVAASRQSANRRQRILVGSLAAGLAITAVLAIVAWLQRQEAIAQRDEARRQRTMVLGRQLAAQSEVVRTSSMNLLDRSALLAVEASRRAAGPDIDRALRSSVGILPALLVEHRQEQPVQAVSITADGALCAAGGDDGVARIWECGDAREVWRLDTGKSIAGVLFAADGAFLAVAGAGGVTLHPLPSGRDITLSRRAAGPLAVAGDLVAAGEKTGRITVWRRDGGVLSEFTVRGEVSALSFSADARLLAAGASDNTVRVWNLDTGVEVVRGQHDEAGASMPLRLGSRDGGVFAVAFDSRGRYVVSGGQDRTVRIRDLSSGREVFRGYQSDAVYTVAFSPDGRWMASGGMDETARVWSLEDGSERHRLTHQYVVQKVLWSAAGNLLTVGGDGTARLWNVGTGAELSRMFDPGYLHDAALSADGSRAITASWDGSTRIWVLTGGGGATLQLPHEEARNADGSPDGKWIASVGTTDFVQLWSLPEGKPVARFPHAPFPSSARFSPDSTRLVTSGWDGLVRIWDVNSRQELGAFQHRGRVVDARFSPDGRVIATAGFEDGTAALIDGQSGTELFRLQHEGVVPKLRMAPGVRTIAFSPDGKLLATGGQDGTVRLWQVDTGREVQRFALGGYITGALFTPDGQQLVADADGSIVVWALAGGARIAAIDKRAEKDDFMSVLAISPDGTLILVGSFEANSVQVRSMPDLKIRASLLHDDDVFSAGFDKAATRVLTGSRDKTARLWDPQTWQEVARVAANDFVYDTWFSPDQRSFVTASGDGFVRVWDVEASAMAASACRRLKRNLTEEEWRQYMGTEAYAATCNVAADTSATKQ